MLVTPSTVAHSVISAQTPCCVCHKISKTVLIQKLFLSSAPSLLPLRPSLPPHPPSGPCWSWHKDANLSGCISLGTTVTAGGLAALSDSILPAISHTHTHTVYVHSLQADWYHHVSAGGSRTHRRGELEEKMEEKERGVVEGRGCMDGRLGLQTARCCQLTSPATAGLQGESLAPIPFSPHPPKHTFSVGLW